MKRITKGHIFSFILGAIIFSSVTALAVTLVGKNVSYNNSHSGLTSTNVQDAVDELHDKISHFSCKPNKVSAWLNSAGVNKNYTTVSQVLADTTTLQTLINSENANDYLAISTDWANDIAANETAMTYIGNNNYSANLLLKNSIWTTAIANSPYFERVLNGLVPPMTGNNTPSGEVTASSCYSNNCSDSAAYACWKAFSGTDTAEWNNSWQSHIEANPWITYKFPSSVVAKKVKMSFLTTHNAAGFRNGSFKIQASNNNTDWTDLTGTIEFSVSTRIAEAALVNNNAYQYYRLYWITPNQSSSSNTYGNIGFLQYYGR